VQVIAAVNNLMQFAFHFNAAGSDFASDFSRLANENFFSGELPINRAVNSGTLSVPLKVTPLPITRLLD
jgi:hypothetical protein